MNATVTPALTQLVPLAQELDKNKVTPGVLGFLVFAALGVAVWMLMRNMNKQLTRISFTEQPERPEGAVDQAGQVGPSDEPGQSDQPDQADPAAGEQSARDEAPTVDGRAKPKAG